MKNGKMPNQRCEICDARPAVARVMVAQKGKRKSMSICDYHYRQLTRHQGMVSPFDSFLGEGGLSRFLVGMHAAANHDAEDESLWPAGEQKESVEPADAFSEQTIELLQRAGEKAHELRRLELDTEHLVYVLADTDVGAALLKELKLSPEDIRGYIDQHAPYGISRVTSATDRMTISPCLKKVFTHAFEASHELGHSYIGPEHLLIGLASVPDSLAGTLLRKYGVSPETIRQKQSAGITLVKGDLAGIARAIVLSRATMRNIRQNLVFAFAYNAIGIPIAAGVFYPAFGLLLSPVVAALAMSLSSVSVIMNALRLRALKL